MTEGSMREGRPASDARKRVLFVAENVTLAQIVRLRELADALDPARYEVWFASSGFPPLVFEGTSFRRAAIESMSGARMLRRVARGARLYDTRTLAGYVREELSLFERLRPDLVVGDLRLSLSVSAPKLGIPYAALINAYWSPFARRDGFPMPEHPLIGLIGVERVAPHFHKALPFVFDHFARPINTLRRRYGLPAIGSLLEVLTHGDQVLHPDVGELVALEAAPPSHRLIGPVLWSPRAAPPAFFDQLDERRPVIYATLGSSGRLRSLRALFEAVAGLPVQVLFASAGRIALRRLPDNVHAAEYLPGDVAARRADLVICNGGSTTGYQALHEGTPVLGLPSNLDQYLAMDAIVRAGAGISLRSGAATATGVRAAIRRLLDEDGPRHHARRLSLALQAVDARAQFVEIVASMLDEPEPQRARRAG